MSIRAYEPMSVGNSVSESACVSEHGGVCRHKETERRMNEERDECVPPFVKI